MTIGNTMKASENYACFSLKDGKEVIALDVTDCFVMM